MYHIGYKELRKEKREARRDLTLEIVACLLFACLLGFVTALWWAGGSLPLN